VAPSDVPSAVPSDVPSMVPSVVPSVAPSAAPSMVRVVRDGSVRYCVDASDDDDDVSSSSSNVVEENVDVLVQFEYEMEYSNSDANNSDSNNNVNDLVSSVEDGMLEDLTKLVLDCNNNNNNGSRLLRRHRVLLQDTTTTTKAVLAINSDPPDQALDASTKPCQLSSTSASSSASCSVVQSMWTIYIAPGTNPTAARLYTLAVLETHLNSNPYATTAANSNSIQILSTKYRGAPPIDALGSNGSGGNSNTNTDNFGTSAAQDVHSILGGEDEDGIVIFSVVLVVLVVGLVLGALYKQYGVSDASLFMADGSSKHGGNGSSSKALQKSYADLDDHGYDDDGDDPLYAFEQQQQQQRSSNRSRRNHRFGSSSNTGRFKNYHVEIDQERSQTHDTAEFYMGDDADSNGWEQCDTPSPQPQAQAQAQPQAARVRYQHQHQYQYHGDTTPTTNNSQNDDSSDGVSSIPPHPQQQQQQRRSTAWDNVHEEDLFLSQQPGFEVQVERPEVLGLSPNHYSNRNLQRRNSYGGETSSATTSSNVMSRTRSTPTSRGGTRPPSYHPDTVDL